MMTRVSATKWFPSEIHNLRVITEPPPLLAITELPSVSSRPQSEQPFRDFYLSEVIITLKFSPSWRSQLRTWSSSNRSFM